MTPGWLVPLVDSVKLVARSTVSRAACPCTGSHGMSRRVDTGAGREPTCESNQLARFLPVPYVVRRGGRTCAFLDNSGSLNVELVVALAPGRRRKAVESISCQRTGNESGFFFVHNIWSITSRCCSNFLCVITRHVGI